MRKFQRIITLRGTKDCPSELISKDINFSPLALKRHWQSGYNDAHKALKQPTWFESALAMNVPLSMKIKLLPQPGKGFAKTLTLCC